MKFLSIEHIEGMVHKCPKTGDLKILEELTRKHPHRSSTLVNKV